MELIDTHTFYGSNEICGINYTVSVFHQQQKAISPQGRVRSIAVSVSKRVNHEISEVVVNNQDVFCGAYLMVLPFGGGVPEDHSTTPSEIEQIIKNDHVGAIKGLKFINVICGLENDSEHLLPYFDIAQRYSLPFMFHCNSQGTEYCSPQKNKRLASKFPGVDFILAHLGGMNADYIEQNLRLAAAVQNIYLNTTGSCGRIRRVSPGDARKIPKEQIDYGFRQYWGKCIQDAMDDPLVAKKLLFGTDFPYLKWDRYPLDILQNLQIEQLQDNAKTLFRL